MRRVGDDRLLAFDYGLSNVRRLDDIPRLPDEGTAPALDTQPVLQLEALFEAPSIESVLDAAAAPPIADRRVLEPAAYAAALSDARNLMLDLASASAGERRAVFAHALEVLEAADADRAVLDVATRALFRG